MKKIMFDEHYGLQSAVIRGYKTMTRRIEKVPKEMMDYPNADYRVISTANKVVEIGRFYDGRLIHKFHLYPKYMVGSTVAIAQSYRELLEKECLSPKREELVCQEVMNGAMGVTNKMYVKSDLMPNRIKITGIKYEKLQAISDEDCMREGIIKREDVLDRQLNPCIRYQYPNSPELFRTPQEAFAALIGKVCTNQTWEFNPWMTCYSFKLV